MTKGVYASLICLSLGIFTACSGGTSQKEAKEIKENTQQEASVQPHEEAPAEEPSSHSEETPATSTAWVGTYSGTLPCADCEGIESKVTLNEDLTYEKVDTYLGKEDANFTEKGSFTWNDDQTVVTLVKDESKTLYKVVESMLIMLDAQGHEVTGELADKYKLSKN